MFLFLVAIPILILVLASLLPRFARPVAFYLALLYFVLEVIFAVFNSGLFTGPLKILDLQISPLLVADRLSIVLIASIGIVAASSLAVARSFFNDTQKLLSFTQALLIAVIGMNAISVTTDIFSMYVFIEVAAIASFIMIAQEKGRDSLEGAFKYIVLSALASVFMLISVGLILAALGTTSLSMIGVSIKSSGGGLIAKLAVAIFLCGALIKSGVMPFHGWLPDAYSKATSPASVVLAGIVTKASGVFVLARLVTGAFAGVSGLSDVLMLLGTFSILAAAFAALTQRDMKRLFAYSSISQVGYIILALGCATPLAVAGAAFHIFNHAVFKGLLFVNAAAVEKRTGNVDLELMGGLARQMPVTGWSSVVASLSAAGIPPLAGFWSKLIIVVALWLAGYHSYAVIAILASVITLAYLLVAQRKAFFGQPLEKFAKVTEAPFGMAATEVVLMFVTIAVGVLFPFVLNDYILPIKSALGML